MKRVMLTVAYDGTNYHGWQIQPNAATIEGELNKHLSDLLGETIEVIGASRTDAGVHALSNIAVFDTNARMPADKISYAMNQRLPDDIKIRESKEVDLDFHPRKAASRKTYEYRIWHDTFPMPTERLDSYFVYVPLDLDAMREAAKHLVGEHDFTSFCSVNTEVESKIRTIYSIDITSADINSVDINTEKMNDSGKTCDKAISHGMICIRICGNGFLYNMVRIIVGTLLEVGKGIYEPDQLQDILTGMDRKLAGPTVPAHGLTLLNYEFVKS